MPSLRNGGIRLRLLALVAAGRSGELPRLRGGCTTMEAHHLVNQPFNVKLPGEFGSAKVAALHHPAALLEPPTRLLFPFIAFALLCSHCCFVLYHLRFVGATWLPAFEPDPAHTGLPA